MAVQRLAARVEEALEDRKGLDIVRLDLRGRSPFTDFFIVVTGTSDTHVRALAEAVDTWAGKNHIPVLGVEGLPAAEWVLLDLGDVVVHVFQRKTREFYDLERLWSPEVAAIEGRRALVAGADGG
ncbi:MAG: ribosome silencing factor [Magnetococcales bacterium]|nr:ribosome silencing factor [Magnetococcales bacterium]